MSKASITPPEFVPSVSDYVAAFKKIKSKITKNQRKMLINHYASHCHVTTSGNLAQSVGFENYRAANLQYGRLAVMLSDAMGFVWRGVSILVLFVPPNTATNTEWLLVMRENVAQALEELGWVEKSSHLYFPLGYDANSTPPDEA